MALVPQDFFFGQLKGADLQEIGEPAGGEEGIRTLDTGFPV